MSAVDLNHISVKEQEKMVIFLKGIATQLLCLQCKNQRR